MGKICCIYLLLLIPFGTVNGQFKGGSGQGIHVVTTSSVNFAATGSAFYGGANDGHGNYSISNLSMISQSSFSGGSDDGSTLSSASSLALQSQSMYSGGANDGVATNFISSLSFITGNMFAGGSDDGTATTISLSTSLNSSSSFAGGADDGIGSMVNNSTNLTSTTMYAGGTDDGFNFITHNATALSPLNSMFSGAGGNDGYSSANNIVLLVLPLRWITFTAAIREKDVALDWIIGNEVPTDGFDIERSFDGISFSKISYLPAYVIAGGSTHYQYIDTDPVLSCIVPDCKTVYYRIKQIGLNHTFEYSVVRRVRFDDAVISFSVYPNPVSDKMFVYCHGVNGMNYEASLYDEVGNLVLSRQGSNSASMEIMVDKLAAGMYYLRITAGGNNYSYPIIIKH